MARRPALLVSALAFYAVFIFRTSLVVLGQRWFVLFEDAMISMRYGRNMAAGAGLVWNAGEKPVEGYTNFLWTLWMAAVHTLGLPDSKVSLVVMLTGVAILLTNALVIERLCRVVTRAEWAPFIAMGSVLFYYPLVFWTLRGMEVGAVALVFDTMLLLAVRFEEEFTVGKAVALGLLGAMGLLIRSDASVSAGIICLYAAATTKGRGRQLVVCGAVGAALGAAVVGQMLFREAVYHEPLPNTYYLKLAHVPLFARLKRGVFVALRVLFFHLAAPLAALAAGIVAWARPPGWWKDKTSRRLLLLATICGIQVAYAVYVGGDAWEWMLYTNRYMSVAMPAFIVLLTALGENLAVSVSADPALGWRAGKAALGVLALCGLGLIVLNGYAHVRPEQGIARTIFPSGSTILGAGVFLFVAAAFIIARRNVGARFIAAFRVLSGHRAMSAAAGLAALVWVPANLHPFLTWAAKNAAQFHDEARYARLGILIGATTKPDTRLAVVAAGATPYFSMRPSEDMLGKNDAFIAKLAPVGVFSPGHDKWNYHYTLGERRPDIMVELLDTTPDDVAYIASLGYVPLANGLYVRSSSTGINRDVLGREYDTEAALDADLELARTATVAGAGVASRSTAP